MEDVFQVISLGTTKVNIIILGVITLLGMVFYYVIKNNVINPAYNLKEITSRLSDGDLTAHAENESNDALGQIGKSVNNMADRFKLIISEIINSAVQVANASEELAAVSKEAQQETTRQKSQTEQVATAMNEMSATSQQATENYKQAAEAPNAADHEAMNGKEIVDHAAKSINTLASEVEHVSEVIQKLQEDSGNIGTVLDVISRDIAEQTNLLALNAAIEEQSTVAEDMNQNITRINEISHNSESNSLQITEACDELAKLASGLQTMVGQFKT